MSRNHCRKGKGAREFDVQKAETMFREALKWRAEVGADDILTTFVPVDVLEKYLPGGFLPGLDKHRCPVYIDPYGRIDMEAPRPKPVNIRIPEGDVARHNEDFTYIFDLQGLRLKHLERHCIDVFLQMARLAESRYPEILRKVLVINSPKIFPIAWRLVSPILQERTRKKIVILSNNYHENLLNEVDADKVPAYYGGTLIDPDGDPNCKTWIGYGGTVPERCYKHAIVRENMTTVVVGRGSTVQLEYTIEHQKGCIRYEFCSADCDIGFGVFKKTSTERQKAGEMDTILTSERVNSHLVPEDGFVECPMPGTYVFRFDNTYSWTRSKTIHYFIEVLEPSDEISVGHSTKDITSVLP